MSGNHHRQWVHESDDGDDEDYLDDADDSPSETIRCSHCGAEIYEDAVQCPHCGSYVTADTNPWSGRSFWWIALGLLGIVALIGALSGWMSW